MDINLPYDIIELIMNKKHQLEIESLKAAHALSIEKWELDIEDMIHVNFREEMEEFEENYINLCSEDEMLNICLDYSKQVFENERVSKIFNDILLYRWREYVIYNV